MNLLNISSMDDLTAFASDRSSRGSRLLMIRLCRRERTSRCASRSGEADCESGPSAGGFGGCCPPGAPGCWGCSGGPGRAPSMRLRSDICACLTLPSGARYPGACSLDSEMYCRKTYVKGSDGDQREELTSEETHAPGAGRRLRGASRGSLRRLGRDALR